MKITVEHIGKMVTSPTWVDSLKIMLVSEKGCTFVAGDSEGNFRIGAVVEYLDEQAAEKK